jgi:S-adenosylmethionine:tRNA ribosyltransferase-isomerase
VRVDAFDYDLPQELIALRPASPRDSARLLVVEPEKTPPIADRLIADLPALLSPGDALVLNDTKVIPAELRGRRTRDGASAEISVTLTKRLDENRWLALARPAKRLKPGDRISFGKEDGVCLLGTLAATLEARGEEGEVTLAFDFSAASLDEAIARVGEMPLPPYIASRRPADTKDRADYQTTFAREEGAVAAPTAGLHFTPELLARLPRVERVTLHVGLDTFRPLTAATLEEHAIHGERYRVEPGAWARIREAPRVVAIGTTTVRVLETLARGGPPEGRTELYVTPGFEFRRVDSLLTNFHLPRTSLLALVMAFAGVEETRELYRLAIAERYRFYSFGDAMYIR